jgi:hypothetical protein
LPNGVERKGPNVDTEDRGEISWPDFDDREIEFAAPLSVALPTTAGIMNW